MGSNESSSFRRVRTRYRSAFLAVGLMSAMINILYLTGSFYMLSVYDRVLPSRSLPTLVALSTLAGGLYCVQGLIDLLRSRLLSRIGVAVDEALHPAVHRAVTTMSLTNEVRGDGLIALRDLDQVRAFLSGPGPVALFDLPWMPFFLGICFLFHPLIGATALAGAVVLVLLTLLTDRMTRDRAKAISVESSLRNGMIDAHRRNAEVVHGMGMSGRLSSRWSRANRLFQTTNRRTADITNGFSIASKTFRTMLQSAILGMGAWLVIDHQATGGIIIASSILTSRALAPVESALANWGKFVAARQGWRRLQDFVATAQDDVEPMPLPKPTRGLKVKGVYATPGAAKRVVLHDVSFALRAGDALGVIGPSGSGKSSLARVILGVWPVLRGEVAIDGAALNQWRPEALGDEIGYLPQDIELFDGTVSDNIARFRSDCDADAVVAAARAADVHDLILTLPQGYNTRLGEGGANLSGGQRQRIALARALFGNPFLVVLDEPNSNLDAEGEQALSAAISGVRARGGIVVVNCHRPAALASCNLVLVMNAGRVEAFGERDDVMGQVLRRPVAAAGNLKVVSNLETAR